MKTHFILILSLIIIMSITISGQTTFYKQLENGVDTVEVFEVARFSSLSIFEPICNLTIKNVGAVACTLAIRGGLYRRTADKWGIQNPPAAGEVLDFAIPLKDSLNAVATSFIFAAGKTYNYFLQNFNLELVKVHILNTTGGKVDLFLETNKWKK